MARGFSLRSTAARHQLPGALTSSQTCGNDGAGTTLLVDPERDVTFVCISSGVMDNNENIEPFQRLSDIAISAAI